MNSFDIDTFLYTRQLLKALKYKIIEKNEKKFIGYCKYIFARRFYNTLIFNWRENNADFQYWKREKYLSL